MSARHRPPSCSTCYPDVKDATVAERCSERSESHAIRPRPQARPRERALALSGPKSSGSSPPLPERIRCKVNYVVTPAGQALKLNLRCASDSYKMDLSANIVQTGTILSGNWFESEYRRGGKISGEHGNGIVKAKIESDTITALLTMRTNGNNQLFAMESPGAWISQVSIQLARDPG
jgi:hypothetical protein